MIHALYYDNDTNKIYGTKILPACAFTNAPTIKIA